MNAELLKKSGIDYDRGVKRFVGRANLYEKALSKFTSDDTFSRISDAYTAGDTQLLLAGAHELKGMCANIALTTLSNTAAAIVQLLRGNDYSSAQLDSVYAKLEQEYHLAYNAVIAAREETI